MKFLLWFLGNIALVIWWSFTVLAYDVIAHAYLGIPVLP